MTKQQAMNCFLDGQFYTEGVTEFWSATMPDPLREGCPTLAGERLTVGSEVHCRPLRFTGNALLVCLQDSKGRTWYSWVHAENDSVALSKWPEETPPSGGTQYLLPIPHNPQG